MTSEMENYLNGLTLLFALVSLSILIGTLIVFAIIDNAYGDDTEDKGISLQEQLLERAREWNIQKAMNETLLIADRYVCFNDLNEYFKFRLEHDNDTNYTVKFPCPDLDISKLPKDESGK